MHDCTCREPREVVLANDDDDEAANKAAFIENLQTLGWSPIVVPKAPFAAPSQDEILAIFRRRRQKQEENSNDTGYVTFIASESGSSEGTIEPKESLEVQLSKCSANSKKTEKASDDGSDETIVKNWCRALSWIAHKVCEELLDLPPNAFLPLDPTESLDLLRVFHYYAVPSSDLTLGSSEHTDWGSFTVVWQDSVGGLQTYCRRRQKWINVKAAEHSQAKNCWKCIVHVGDIASLVLDDSKTCKETSEQEISHPWPSPRHRVKSHPHKERVSLVYFGYPPRGVSLGEIQSHLDEGWPHSATRGKKLPLSEYFLLRNQSSGASDEQETKESEASRLYQTMWNLPIEDIVRLKWEQVSR